MDNQEDTLGGAIPENTPSSLNFYEKSNSSPKKRDKQPSPDFFMNFDHKN